MKTETKCLHQVFRPKISLGSLMNSSCHEKGNGDCATCRSDEWNRFCSNYYPISVAIFGITGETVNNKLGAEELELVG